MQNRAAEAVACIGRVLAAVGQLGADLAAIAGLRTQTARLKLEGYDAVAENLRGLRAVVGTLQRAQGDLRDQLQAREEQIEAIRSEYAALKAQHGAGNPDWARAQRLALFRQLQPVVTQLPSLQAAVQQGADVTARDVIELLAPLGLMLEDMGFERIGEAGAEIPYDPARHHLAGAGAQDAAAGEPVRVRYVGFTLDGEVVCKAEVARLRTQVKPG
jgi:hypothetical protein